MNRISFAVSEVSKPYLHEKSDKNFQLRRNVLGEVLDSKGYKTGEHVFCTLTDHDALLPLEQLSFLTVKLRFQVEIDEIATHQVVYAEVSDYC